ncbi:hypothetical protein DPEC_G00014730 [Dallia pectoralis]|uniref:Uncharacterized protein n=1 Tax=Dallia pectoralis TaxID=75939 RepID=A0ACC2HML2_DALPE|nr:hypothetical protein DPEC_G00014730 [Dallia pectoralis]
MKTLQMCLAVNCILLNIKSSSACGPAEYRIRDECCPMCAPGYRVYKHCTEFTSTSCSPCIGSTYIDHPSGRPACLSCTNCDPGFGLMVKQSCRPSSDTVFEPLEGFYCTEPDKDGCKAAQRHSSCKPGQYIRQKGTPSTDTVCSDCTGETYSDGSFTSCRPHTQCNMMKLQEIRPGTSWSDSELQEEPLVQEFGVCAWLRSRWGEATISGIRTKSLWTMRNLLLLVVYWYQLTGAQGTQTCQIQGSAAVCSGLSLHQALPDGIFNGLVTLEIMDLTFNSLTYLQPDIFPESLKIVDLSYNFLASPDPTAFSSLNWINLYKNRFHCDCQLKDFLTWLNGTNVTFADPGVPEFSCEYPSDLLGTTLLNYSRVIQCEEDDEGLNQELRLSLFISCSTLILLVTVGTIGFAHLRGYLFKVYKKVVGRVLEGPRKEPPAGGAQYDAYICFSNNDYTWVERAMLNRLDSQMATSNFLRCCFEARDFIPGEDHLCNIRDAIWGSRKTVCVVSKEFLKDGWCLEAFTLAHCRMLEELRDVLIMVIVGNVPHYRLMKHEAIRNFVHKREYLLWPEDSQDLEWFYDKLTYKIIKDKKIKKITKKDTDDLVLVNMPTVAT